MVRPLEGHLLYVGATNTGKTELSSSARVPPGSLEIPHLPDSAVEQYLPD